VTARPGMGKSVRLALAMAALSIPLSSAVPARAGGWLMIGGAERAVGRGDSRGSYAYLGAVAPLGGERLGTGFFHRYLLDGVGYDYPLGGGTVDATVAGLEAGLGWQTGGLRGWGSVSVGARYSHTRLSPDDPGSAVRGDKLWGKLQVEGERMLTPGWKVNGGASYTFGLDGYWVRARALARVRNAVFTGPEVVLQGDPDYRSREWGWVVTGLEPWPRMEMALKAGVGKTKDRESIGYFGIEFARLF